MRAALVRTSDYIVDNVIEVDGDYLAPEGFLSVPSDTANIGDKWDGTDFDPETPPPEQSAQRSMSVLEFMDRFTMTEQLNITMARQLDAHLSLWYDRMLAAGYIDLDDPRTIEGVESLFPSLLTTYDRVNAILGRENPE